MDHSILHLSFQTQMAFQNSSNFIFSCGNYSYTTADIFTWGNLNAYAIYREWFCGDTAQEGNRVDAGLQQSNYFAQIES